MEQKADGAGQRVRTGLKSAMEKITLKNTLKVASGLSLLGQVGKSAQKLSGEMGYIKDAVSGKSNEAEKELLQSFHDGSSEKIPAENKATYKYVVFSHTKNILVYGNDYAACMLDAYTQKELDLMVSNTRTSRRIQAYGAIIIFLLSLLFVGLSNSVAPLFSIFPAMMLMSFALRRACFEMTIETLNPTTIQMFLSQRGMLSLWK